LAKKILANLSPAPSFFRYYKQLADKTLANLSPVSIQCSLFRYYKQLADKTLADLLQIAKFAKSFFPPKFSAIQ